jgi:hypothetical protein
MQDTLMQELIAVARQGVEYARERGKHHFVCHAENVLTVVTAVQKGREIGLQQGWDVFEVGSGCWAVQSDDEQEKIDDVQAIALAQAAGIKTNDFGSLINKLGDPIREVGAVSC